MNYKSIVKKLYEKHESVMKLSNFINRQGYKSGEYPSIKGTVIHIDKSRTFCIIDEYLSCRQGCIVFLEDGIYYTDIGTRKGISFWNYRLIHDSNCVISNQAELVPVEDVNNHIQKLIISHWKHFEEAIHKILTDRPIEE